MNEQLSFMPNGNIAPCPYIRECDTYGIGCQGTSYWCKRFDKKKDKKPEYGDRGCNVCQWYNKKKNDCTWHIDFDTKEIYPDCHFMPADYRGIPMCANCQYANCFIYETKPEYKDNHSKAMNDPVEEPNIYCDHRDGSLNRRTAYKDLEQANFGVGHWNRQHEWDICDRWEEEQ